jgi:hypothetical protein
MINPQGGATMRHLFTLAALAVLVLSVGWAQMDFNPNAPPIEGAAPPADNPLTIVATWATMAPSPVPNSRSCVAYIEVSGVPYVYQFGGGSLFNEVARYNISTNSWTSGFTTIPVNISSGTAITVGDSTIYIFGGESGGGLGRTVRYNVYTNTWTTLAPMLTLVTDAAVVKYRDTLVYVIGGGDGLFGTTVFNSVQLYNIRTNTYTSAGTYPIAAAMMGFGIYKDTIIVAGGWTGAAATPSAYKGIINPANPTQITWTALPNYPVDPTGVTRIASSFVARNTGGGILFSGGAIGGATLTNQSYLWDLCNGNWAVLPVLPLARSNMKAATARGDSVAYVVAGFTTAGTGQTDRITFSQIDGSCIVSGSGPLNAFNLQTPPPGTTITTLAGSTTPVSSTWDTSAAGASYKWIFGAPVVPPRLFTLPTTTNALNTTLGALDAVLAGAGLQQGDSVIGQWDVWAFRNNPPQNDSLKSTNGPRAIILKRGRPALNAFNLVSPASGTTVTTNPISTTPINFVWRKSGDGVNYRWKFATPTFAGTVRLNIPTALDTFATFRTSQLDSLIAGLGVATGDSITGQWRAYAYSGTDSLASAQTFNVTFKRGSIPCLANFTVTRTTGITYNTISTTGTSFAGWRNTTSIDDNRSNSTPIGFNFNYIGVDYTSFSASTNGFMDLSSSAATGSGTAAYGYQNTQFTATTGTLLAMGPLYDDLIFPTGTAQTNMMRYQLDGTAPNRVLTVEWIGVRQFASSTVGNMNFQVKLYETSNKIEFVYGPMDPGTGTMSYTIGLNGPTMSGTPGLCELLTQQTANTATFSNIPQNALVTAPESNTMISFTLGTSSVEPVPGVLPSEFTLSQNYPNPFNPATRFQYSVPEQATISLKVYNLLGQEVVTLFSGAQNPGQFEATWDGRSSSGVQVSSGVYFYRMEAKSASTGSVFVSQKKMLLLK